MDNNNNLENFEGGLEVSASDNGASVPDTQTFSQGRYPQPPEWTKNIVISQTPWPAPGEKGNVSVRLNEPEKQLPPVTETEENPSDEEVGKKEWPMWMQIGLVVLFALIAALLGKYAYQVRKPAEMAATDVIQVIPTTVPSSVGTTAPVTMPSVTDNTEKNTVSDNEKETPTVKEEKTTAKKEEKTTKADKEKTSAPASDKDGQEEKVKKEIIKYFNESSNRVKTESTKIVKNFEKRTHNADKLVIPSAIKGVAQNLLDSNFTEVIEAVEYPTHEEIVAKYPVPGQEWSSKLTAEDVSKAICMENGDEYEITLYLNPSVDPEPGKGVSRAIDCLNVPMVRDTAPEFITAFSADYYDCVIRCRVEKTTGRVIWSNYTTPVVIKVGLDAGFVKFDAEIGLTFEKDYSITY